VKIARQPLCFSTPLNLGTLGAHCGESLRPFRIKNLQIPLPATPFLSHPCKTPGVSPSVLPLWSGFCALCVALFLAPLLFSTAYSLLPLSLPSFSHLHPLFSIISSLFSQNTRGGGYPPSKVGQPFLAVLQRSPNNPPPQSTGGPMPSKPALPSNPPLEYLHFPLRTSNSYSPKWSIIPAPVSATRLRGRSV
jgi:hypothetical protein